MKTKIFYAVSFFLMAIYCLSVTSCSSSNEPVIKPGIMKTDTPPEALFSNNNYASTYKCWIDAEALSQVKDKGEGCLFWTDENGVQNSRFCGTWKIFPCKKYWGILNGVIYLSNSIEWYIVSPDVFYGIRDAIEKKGTLVAYMSLNMNTPWGWAPGIDGIE